MRATVMRWAPVVAAAVIAIVAVLLALDVPVQSVEPPPPLPRAIHVIGREAGTLNAETAAPLFADGRSNGPATAATPVTPAPVLVGVAGAGARRVALLKQSSGETRIAHVGDTVDGWRLVALDARTATIDDGRERKTIELGFGPASAVAIAASQGNSVSPAGSEAR